VEVGALDVLHHDVGVAVEVAVGVYADDVGVAHAAERAELPAEPLQARLEAVAAQDLERDGIVVGIPRQDHERHAAFADGALVDIRADTLPRMERDPSHLEDVALKLCVAHRETPCERQG
jgi:hypothetical protein